MTRKYFASRNNQQKISIDQLYEKLQNLYFLFREKDFLKEKAKINSHESDTKWVPESIMRIAAIKLNFSPFPIDEWNPQDINEENIFSCIEFLFDHVSKPGELVDMITPTGWNYQDYDSYDELTGRNEFREYANFFLLDYKNGFELTEEGEIISLGEHGLQFILNADIVPYDAVNVDRKVVNALSIWKNRKSSLEERKKAIQELADVFEWLKKSQKLDSILNKKDEAALFNIANNFAIRHHDPKQKSNYDLNIWYSWIFHFYLATYHASIRMIIKKETA